MNIANPASADPRFNNLHPITEGNEERVLYQALVASLSDMGEGMMIIENRRFTFVNQAICDILGYSPEELLAWESFLPAFHPSQQVLIIERHRRRIAGEEFDTCYETAFIHRLGHRIDVEISVAFLRHEASKGVVITVRDISQRKASEEEIQRKNDDLELLKTSLEQKVRERTIELQTANKELTKLNQVKSDFISIVSHELRTPLTSIKSFAEIMLDDIEEQSLETQYRYLSIINSESDRLSRLISDILDLQKIDCGKIIWNDEMIDVVKIARASVELFTANYAEGGIALSFSTDHDVLMTEAEPDRISQVINNLLSNALKFTNEGQVKLHLRLVESYYSPDPMIQISVSDTGIGIPQEEVERVFDRFYQVDSSQRRVHEGAGLGLSICKDIVEHYQGKIRLESKLGEGTTFFLTLPELHQPRKKLGEVLIELGMLTEQDLSAALDKQSQPNDGGSACL